MGTMGASTRYKIAVTCYLFGALAVIVLHVNATLAAAVPTTNTEDSQITSQLNEQYEYCSIPHEEVFNIRYALSNDTNSKGLVTNHIDVSHLLDDDNVFHPENIVVPRCDATCQHIDWNGKVECKAVPDKVAIWFSATKKGGQPQYYQLDVVQHSECECTFNGLEPNETVSTISASESSENESSTGGFELSETVLKIDSFGPNETTLQVHVSESSKNELQNDSYESNVIVFQNDGFGSDETTSQIDDFERNKTASEINGVKPKDSESNNQNSSGQSQLRMNHVVFFTPVTMLLALSILLK